MNYTDIIKSIKDSKRAVAVQVFNEDKCGNIGVMFREAAGRYGIEVTVKMARTIVDAADPRSDIVMMLVKLRDEA